MKQHYFLIAVFSLLTSVALAGPGAHGPNGEHLDGAAGTHVHSDAGPRVETFTESFELVGQLQESELSILIDRYETNEPVLGAKLEVDYNGLKTVAKFHSDHGDYAVNDKKLLDALRKPGQHALLFTLTAGAEGDLLEGTMTIDALEGEPHHEHPANRWYAIGLVGLIIIGALAARVIYQRRRRASPEIAR